MISFRLAKKILLTNSVYKVIAVIAGTSLWWILGQTLGTSLWLTIPLSFYNTDHIPVDAPAHIQVQLTGKRSDLYALDREQIALHIDGSQLNKGKNSITIANDTLLLPDQIKVRASRPSNVLVTLI